MMSPRGDADVAGGVVAEIEQVAQHLPLGRGEVAGDRALVLRLLDRLLDLVAQRRLGIVAEEQAPGSRATGATRRPSLRLAISCRAS